jgi:hypothetical protein
VKQTPFYGGYKITFTNLPEGTISIVPSDKESFTTEEVARIKAHTKNTNLVFETEKTISSEYVVFVNSGFVPENEDWVTELQSWAQLPDVGIVTGRISDSQHMVLEAGVDYEPGGKRIIFSERNVPDTSLGYYFRLALQRDIIASSELLMMVKKSDLEQVSLPTERTLDWGVNWSLELVKKLNKRVVYTPYATGQIDEKMTLMTNED